MRAASRILSALTRMLRPTGGPAGTGPASRSARTAATERGIATVAVPAPAAGALSIGYAPERDGAPDAGEIVWTWVPYDEDDGRGKDRPVLVIARQDTERVYAVRLTSKPHERDRDYLALGAGEWDAAGRPSWVDIEQLYSVHASGMRREAAALDPVRFGVVADALHRRYGWGTARS
jgi:hypothetical protein